jgi:DUF438 domain-containing protein
MRDISPATSIQNLLEEYPFLMDFLMERNPKFSLLKNPMMRATIGKVATIEKAANMVGEDLETLLSAIGGEVARRTNDEAGEPDGLDRKYPGDRVAELKSLILDLHRGIEPDAARASFNAVVKEVSPLEIGAMEEQLIREGMPVEEIQRLCDLHVAVVQDSLENQEEIEAPPGHPIHTYLAENEIITSVANRLGQLCGDEQEEFSADPAWSDQLAAVLEEISGIDNHYLRKENELFPVLERHGVTGPSQVMWGVHDEIRARVKSAKALLASGPVEEARAAGTSLARAAVEMVYKENKILFPLAQETLSHEEWAKVREGEDGLGYAFVKPSAPFPTSPPSQLQAKPIPSCGPTSKPASGPPTKGIGLPIVSAAPPASLPEAAEGAYVDLGTGRLSIEQVDLILRHLPIEISFVDADGFVRYYSDTEERLFPRTPGAIGRHVKNCHPPKSVNMVQEILRKFAEGERDVAEFWIQMQAKFIHIRYFAVRNASKEYLGCLEVTQDVTPIRALEGQQRLLDWN